MSTAFDIISCGQTFPTPARTFFQLWIEWGMVTVSLEAFFLHFVYILNIGQ